MLLAPASSAVARRLTGMRTNIRMHYPTINILSELNWLVQRTGKPSIDSTKRAWIPWLVVAKEFIDKMMIIMKQVQDKLAWGRDSPLVSDL